MRHHLIILAFALTLCACNSTGKSEFSDVPCSINDTPEYDGRKVSLLDENGVAYKDTILEQIEKRRTVFKPCRDYIYRANYYTKDAELITSNRIKVTATGRRWESQPEIQDEIIIQYEYTKSDLDKAREHSLNEKNKKLSWHPETTTGIIENVEKIWMHPFRSNQYSFTQVAPFPEVRFPLKAGKSWSGQLRIGNGWGDWENTLGNFRYKVISKESIRTLYGEIDSCWKIESRAKYAFGISIFNYWFDEELGFVKMEYVNYGDQKLEIILEEVHNR